MSKALIDWGSSEEVQPWERQADEPESAWTVFRAYRDLGAKRSLRAAYIAVNGDGAGINPHHHGKWQWQRRAAAYDNFVERQIKAREIEEQADMRARYIKTAKTLHAICASEIGCILEEIKKRRESGKGGRVLEVKEIIKLLELSFRLETTSHGQASEIMGHQDSGKTLTFADLAARVDEAQRAQQPAGIAEVVDIKELPEGKPQ